MEYVKIHKNAKDITNQKFGSLTVLGPIGANSHRQMQWECQCDCGNIIVCLGNSLRNGHTTSCGCSHKDKGIHDLTGKKFGLLTALEIVGTDNGRHKIWRCVCDCGNYKNVSSHELVAGSTKSCGCLHSWGETYIKKYLINHNISFISEYSFNDLYLKKKHKPLRFDFCFIKDDKILLLLEFQGKFHYEVNNKYHNETTQLRDEMKRNYCNKHSIPLEYINYNDNIDQLLERYIKDYGLSGNY